MDKFKVIMITICSLAVSLWNKLSLPLILLMISNIIDIITGLWKATYIKERITFKRIIWGTIKKISMYFLILSGYIIDVIINYTVENFEINIGLGGIVGNLIAVWLVLNEQLSIIKNLTIMKVPMPNFIIELVKKLKNKIDWKDKI